MHDTRTILVTGIAGFIGYHVAKRLVEDGWNVVGIDNCNDYYDPSLKHARLAQLGNSVTFYLGDIEDKGLIASIFETHKPELVCHLAAQAGVRYSIENPDAYISSNIVGFLNILEACRRHKPRHLFYASSSSVYGANTDVPFRTTDRVDQPVSLYAVTKRSNELMAYCYNHLYQIPCTGLRFFTVYGPWGRPDMAYFSFAEKILAREPINIYNHGNLSRDFTYIDDIVESIIRLLGAVDTHDDQVRASRWLARDGAHDDDARACDDAMQAHADDAIRAHADDAMRAHDDDAMRAHADDAMRAHADDAMRASHRLAPTYNIGNGAPVSLLDFVEILEQELGMPAIKEYVDMQPGDVATTWADCEELFELTKFRPQTDLRTGLQRFVAWYKEYYRGGTL
jgi:UDP-glucuronate 4-epimerase